MFFMGKHSLQRAKAVMRALAVVNIIPIGMFCVVAGIVTAQQSSPAQCRGSISGMIFVEGAGSAAPRAIVAIVGFEVSAVTDTEGRFVFPDIPCGKYNLTISGALYEVKQVFDIPVSATLS